MSADPIVIVGYARTALGGLMGELAAKRAPDLGAAAISAAMERGGLSAADPDEVFMGNVLPAGIGQNPARQAALAAGLPQSVPCTTVSKVCGSGMKANMLAADLLAVGTGDVFVAGGMESMSNAPYLLNKARGGYRLGHGEIKDHMFVDGLEDAYEPGRLMGVYGDETARVYGISREAQDDFAIRSLDRAQTANEDGTFAREITPVTIHSKKGQTTVDRDEQPRSAKPDRIPHLKPAFSPDGTITPANASSISDGAAALALMRRSTAERRGLTPLATIRGHAGHAQEPAWFTTAPVGAIKKLHEQVGWTAGEVDLYEINEAFAVVTLAAMQQLGLSHEQVNVHGGACALGHPLGASGARIIVTLLGAMEAHDVKRGIASLCIGGGEATAIALERA
ncbi:acetyl-CoA C-acetyltransferase [Limimonas halophila]|uniref:Acetyl-CoA C-acetyltransferase n=1 Tax=Limimonas halophila TaxID=1082479 RepID=A0A1G7QHR2_9PROT|nr:acetyl-CoA C-acyltransferase [Limimonas halophila]SDF98054.1 acetyl-CoA C-acetyltransferase [Limimonas halophila]